MNTRTYLAATLPLLATALAGCNFELGQSTPGTEGHARFSYSGWSCLFGCDVTQPMMVGTQETVSIDGDSLPADLTVRAEDPSVLGVSLDHTQECCVPSQGGTACSDTPVGAPCSGDARQTYLVHVTASAAGQTRLLVHQADGSLFDATSLRIDAPAVITLSCTGNDGAPDALLGSVTLAAGSDCALEATAENAAGQPLRASSGFDIVTADAKVARVDPAFSLGLSFGNPPPNGIKDADGKLTAVGAGTTKLTATAGAVKTGIDVTVK